MRDFIRFSPAQILTVDTVSLDLKRLSDTLNQHPETPLILDLSGVLQCDTAGLALLIEAKRLCAIKQSRLMIENMSDAMIKLATFCGVAPLFLGELADD